MQKCEALLCLNIKIKKVLLATAVAVTFLSGCASVPMEGKEQTDMAKKFDPPSDENAGLYIYRTGSVGGALKKYIWVDGKCVGEAAVLTSKLTETGRIGR